MQTPEVPFTRLGRYEVLAPIAAGGMASVYVGRATDAGARPVALKVIRPEHARNKEFVAMFLDEAGIVSNLAHPNIVELVEFGHDGARYFLAMDLVLGQTLARIADVSRAKGKKLPYDVVAWIGARIADGLHHAHELTDSQGAPLHVVHRDVNPSNILVAYDGTPKIIDFGLARAASRIASTAAGVVKGKLAYLAPEQAHRQEIDRRADVFQLGITLWELALDRRLFKTDDEVETVRRVMKSEIPDPRSIDPAFPSALAEVILRSLARDRDKRTPTAADLARELDAFVDGRADAKTVAALVAALFPEDGRRSIWEQRAREITKGRDAAADVMGDASRLLAWDDDAQKMTWMAVEGGAAAAAGLDRGPLRATLAALSTQSDDPVGAARAHVELALLDEDDGDRAGAERHARGAIAIDPASAAAHAILRRVGHGRDAAGELVSHLDAELAGATSDDARADLLAERARLLAASGAGAEAVIEAWGRALAVRPAHAAALKGMELALGGDARRTADHLARLADAYAAEPRLAAWLHVERASHLDALGDPDGAKGALAKGLAIDGGLGPTRGAAVAHASAYRDAETLVTLFDEEARLETDGARAARLELDAACLAVLELADRERARALLERAHARMPTSLRVDRRVLDELVRLHVRARRWPEARWARSRRLAFLASTRERADELVAMAVHAMSADEPDAAIADLEAARATDRDARGALDLLDALLAKDPPRHEALWMTEGQRDGDPARRVKAWSRAASIASARGAQAAAVGHLRAALAITPDDGELAERLSSLLEPLRPAEGDVRGRITAAIQALEGAAAARDEARRVAMIERVALMWEEAANDPAMAAAAYEDALRREPGRRSALLGLQRCAARLGDGARLARALLDEAGVVGDDDVADALRVRAAEVLAPIDADRALHLSEEVLGRRPADDRARSIAMELHQRAGRWARYDAELAARIEHATTPAAKVEGWLRRADVQQGPLALPADALASLRAARAIDPQYPSLGESIAALVEATSDAKALRDATIALAGDAGSVDERVRHRVRAAEIDELALLDDAAAEEGYAAALADAPDDAWIASRLARVAARRRKAGGDKKPTATEIEAELARDPKAPHALRGLEAMAREQGSTPLLANALEQQAGAFTADAPVLGALWGEADLIEWSLPASDAVDVYERILVRAPGDRAALDALLRRSRSRARLDARARDAASRALSGLLAHATDDTARLAIRLGLATLLDPGESEGDPTMALAHYRAALQIDPRSPTAAFGAARLAAIAKDPEAIVVAACARAELAPPGKERGALLVQAAGVLVASGDPRLGSKEERRPRAIALLEQALVADPNATMAAGMLGPLCMEARERDRLIAALRGALERADRRDAIAQLGLDLARVTAHVAADRPIAIAALERVRAAAPDHVPALFALAEAYAADLAWPEAIACYEAAALHARDPQAKKRALLSLADAYGRSLGPAAAAEAERAYRGACEADPTDARALRGLLDRLRAPDRVDAPGVRQEVAEILARFAEVEHGSDAQAALYLELAEARAALGDRIGAEKALVESAARAPGTATLARVIGASPAPSDQARVLAAIARRAADLGGATTDVLAALAAIEVDVLGRAVDGVAHARTALAANPGDAETRAVLARGLAQSGRHGEAAAATLGLLEPDPAPLATLRDPAAPLAVLDASYAADRRDADAIVARELRAMAGGVDDATVVQLCARRLGPPRTGARLDRDALIIHAVPASAPRVLLEIAAAVAGVESKVFPEDLEDVGLSPRDRIASSHAIRAVFHRVARALGVEEVELAMGDDVPYPRVVSRGEPWVVAPTSLLARAEPVQIAAFARVLTRVALAVPWIERVPPAHARAFLVASARVVSPGWGAELRDKPLEEAVASYAGPIARSIGRKQKKALAALVTTIDTAPPPPLAAADALVLGVARAEARAAFLVGGDLLAVFEELRGADPELARATATRAPAGLAAILAHPIAGDVARFALTPAATGLRRDLGAIAEAPRGV